MGCSYDIHSLPKRESISLQYFLISKAKNLNYKRGGSSSTIIILKESFGNYPQMDRYPYDISIINNIY